MAHSEEVDLPNYVAKVIGADGRAKGTCFQLSPGHFITAAHVLEHLDPAIEGHRVNIQSFDDDHILSAVTVLRDSASDLALLHSEGILKTRERNLTLRTSPRLGTEISVGGLSWSPFEDLEYTQLSGTGKWQGLTRRPDGLRMGRIESSAVTKGMSGSPVRTRDGSIVGVISARYNSADDYLRNSVWIATSDMLLDLIEHLPDNQPRPSFTVVSRPSRAEVAAAIAERRAATVAQIEEVFSLQGHEATPPPKADWSASLDLVVCVPVLGRQRTLGVRSLSMLGVPRASDLSKAYLSAEPALSARHIDELLIVTEIEPKLDIRAWEKAHANATIQNIDALLRTSLDFSGYMQQSSRMFERSADGLPLYYVHPRTRAGEDLEEQVQKWVADDPSSEFPTSQPIAILGSYGLGKTTFSVHLTTTLAAARLKSPTARTPVLISLGDLATQQDLEGLIGKHFTATNQVPGFSFSLFMEMNRSGHFVVILDGFDEMKHLLTWSEFKYNLAQLNRLVEGRSKVILLGRPTAFENDAEMEEALHGKIGTSESKPQLGLRVVDYYELELAPLEPSQVREFLHGYAKFAQSLNRPFDFEAVWQQVKTKRLKDIAQRPVQLKMLADILPHYTGSLDKLDLVTLYDTFVDQLINHVLERETVEKHSRIAFGRTERRTFLAKLAFWIWEQPAGRIVTSDQIPDDIVEPFRRGHEIGQVRRDLVTGSPLDRRAGERIRFAHRSFQEFLVAEETWSRMESEALTVREFDGLSTDEVASFVRLLRRPSHASAVRRQLIETRGALTWRTVYSVLAEESTCRSLIADMNRAAVSTASTGQDFSPWEILAPLVEAIERREPSPVDIRAFRSQTIRELEDVDHLVLCLFLAVTCVPPAGTTQLERDSVVNECVRSVLLARTARETVEAESFRTVGPRRRVLDPKYSEYRASSRPDDPRRRGRSAPTRSGLEYQFADNRMPFVPLGERYVADLRSSALSLGRYLSSSYLFTKDKRFVRDSLAIHGGERVEIAWTSRTSLRLARALSGSSELDARRLSSFLAREILEVACVSNWIDERSVRKDILGRSNFSLSPDTILLIEELCKAESRLKSELNGRGLS